MIRKFLIRQIILIVGTLPYNIFTRVIFATVTFIVICMLPTDFRSYLSMSVEMNRINVMFQTCNLPGSAINLNFHVDAKTFQPSIK